MRWIYLCAPLLGLLALACEGSNDDKRPPETPHNTDHAVYATEYPERVEQVTKDIDEDKAKAAEACGKYQTYPDQIKEPTDYEKVGAVVEASDQSGRSGEYAERARQNRQFQRMLDENDGELGKSVSGAVHGAAQTDGCPNPGNVSGAASGGMKRGVEKRSEARLREVNEGHRLIKRNRKKLGKPNVPALEKQADEIAEASYIAYVELPELKYELERLIEENERVKDTLEKEIEEEKKQAKEYDDAEDKKESEERIKDLEEAKQKLESQQEQLKQREEQLEQLEQEIQKVQEDCDKAMKDLKDELDDRAGKAPKKSEKKDKS